MKGRLRTRCLLLFLLATASAISSCARSPGGTAVAVVREMSFRIDFNGPIDDSYYYFVPIDTTGGGDGPTPVFPGMATGEAWVTGAATYFVQYHQRQYTLHRITSLQPFRSELIGSPTQSTLPDIGGTALRFTIDLDEISATGDSVDVNIIAVDQPLADIRILDGLGPRGTDFLNLDITSDRTITNSGPENPVPVEGSGDVLDQNQDLASDQSAEYVRPLDIVDWSITTDV